MKYQIVPRPWLTKNRTGLYDALYDAIEHTAVNGNAVEVELNGFSAKRIRDTLRRHLAKRGLWLRSPRFGDVLKVWAEETRQVGPVRGREAKVKLRKTVRTVALSLLLAFLPAIVLAQTTTAKAVLSWGDVANEDSYRVERSDDGGATYSAKGTTAVNVTTFTDTNAGAGLALNTLYCWRVVSVNAFGEATPSSPACAQASTPSQVTNVTVTLTPNP